MTVGSVLHLHRIRSALRVLLIPSGDRCRALDPAWLRQADTALTTLAAHYQTLPRTSRAALEVVLDSAAPPGERHQALLDAADLLRVELHGGDVTGSGPTASVLRHPSQYRRPAQGQLFDPA